MKPKCETTVWDADPDYLLRRCEIRDPVHSTVRIDLDVLPRDAPLRTQEELTTEGLLAQMTLKTENGHLKVGFIEVDPKYRHKRWGTKLYERALAEACAFQRPLSSDTMRSEFSEAFWRKQVVKGRAKCADHEEGYYWPDPRAAIEDALDRGEITASEYRRRVDNLPEPERNEMGDKVWPCRRYEIKDNPCVRQSLAGPGGRGRARNPPGRGARRR